MHTLFLVSPQVGNWCEFADFLENQYDFKTVKARSTHEALEAVRDQRPLAVVVDAELGDLSGIELVRRLLMVNAMVHTALVSGEAEAIFHEKTEGLGILTPLPPVLTPKDAAHLAACLEKVVGHSLQRPES